MRVCNNLYDEMYSGMKEIKESVSNALSQITDEERAELMRKNMEPDKDDININP
jgi:hypothetical protein